MTDTDRDVSILEVDENDPAALWHQPRGAARASGAYVTLDPDARTVTADVWTNSASSMPMRAWRGLDLRWRLPHPVPTAAAANRLMRDALPLLRRVCDGWSGDLRDGHRVGVLTRDAQDATQEIAERLDSLLGGVDYASVELGDAGDWYAGEGDAGTAARLGITPDTSDEDLEHLADAEALDVEHEPTTHRVLRSEDALAVLARIRDGLRDAAEGDAE